MKLKKAVGYSGSEYITNHKKKETFCGIFQQKAKKEVGQNSILRLEEMEELGLLLLLLSKFCAETMYSDKESIAKIQSLKQVWEKLRNPKAE